MKLTPTVLITGGSRGIGAATALAFARRGFDAALTYRSKAARAEEVAAGVRALGRRAFPLGADLTCHANLQCLVEQLAAWTDHLDVLVLNASGGLERDLLAADPRYPWRINCDAQVATVDALLPLLHPSSTIVFVTSHWAHLYGRVDQFPAYEPVAASKWAGEQALRAREDELSARGIRLLVVTGDLIEGTITPRLLERNGRGLMAERREALGGLPSVEDMGEAIAAAMDRSLGWGETIVVGGALETLS